MPLPQLARAATEAAAKTPLPGAKGMYVRLAEAWLALADENVATDPPEFAGGTPSSHPLLHVKLKDGP